MGSRSSTSPTRKNGKTTRNAAKERATFLSRCGPAAFQLAKALVAPGHLKNKSFETTLVAQQDHLAPKPPELAWRYELHRHNQAPSEFPAAYLAALRTTAQRCNFNDLDTVQRDRFVFRLQNDTVKRRLLTKKEGSLTSAVEEAVAAEAITREGNFISLQSTSAPHVEPVHHGTTKGDDCEKSASEDVLRLCAGAYQQRGVERQSSGFCASCGGPHKRRLCRFHAVQCRECGKIGHTAKVCRSRWQSGPRRSSETDGRTQCSKTAPHRNMAYCDDFGVTAINAVSQPAHEEEFRGFMDANLIRHVTSTLFHLSTNGQAERMVRTTKEALSRIIQGIWARRLADFTLQQHVTPHTTTGRSPSELMMGRRLSTMLNWLHPERAPERFPIFTEALPAAHKFQP
ncbi:hypothetical protein MTO96_008161 [Rhipicephalus appendiculatus]